MIDTSQSHFIYKAFGHTVICSGRRQTTVMLWSKWSLHSDWSGCVCVWATARVCAWIHYSMLKWVHRSNCYSSIHLCLACSGSNCIWIYLCSKHPNILVYTLHILLRVQKFNIRIPDKFPAFYTHKYAQKWHSQTQTTWTMKPKILGPVATENHF